MSENINWDELTSSDAYVTLEEDKLKTLVITNWRVETKEKFGKVQAELMMDVLEEDGEAVDEKQWTTVSKRLKTKLRPVLEGKDPASKIKLTATKIGDKFNTNYSIVELKEY